MTRGYAVVLSVSVL